MADFENNDVIRIAARTSWDYVYDLVNVWHVILDSGGPLTFGEITLAVQNYMDTIYGYLTTYICNNQRAETIAVSNATQDTVFGAIGWGSWTAGTATGASTPLGCALFAWGRTHKPRVQIRKYFGVFEAANQVDGVWQSAVRTQCDTAMGYHIAQQTPATGVTWTGVAFNRTTKGVTYAYTPATSAEVAYQRRRKRGRGG